MLTLAKCECQHPCKPKNLNMKIEVIRIKTPSSVRHTQNHWCHPRGGATGRVRRGQSETDSSSGDHERLKHTRTLRYFSLDLNVDRVTEHENTKSSRVNEADDRQQHVWRLSSHNALCHVQQLLHAESSASIWIPRPIRNILVDWKCHIKDADCQWLCAPSHLSVPLRNTFVSKSNIQQINQEIKSETRVQQKNNKVRSRHRTLG